MRVGPTDGWTDTPSYRDAMAHLKSRDESNATNSRFTECLMRLSARWRITRYQEFCAFPFASRWPLNRLKLSLMNSSMSLFAILYSFLVLRACGKLLKAAELPTLVVKARGNPRCQTSTDKGPLKKALWKLRLLETWDFLHWAHEAKIWSLFQKNLNLFIMSLRASEWASEQTNERSGASSVE